MLKDIEKTVHLSKESQALTQGFQISIPENAVIVEPCVGDGDLLGLFPLHSWETYDIRDEANPRNTLLNPPCYKDKFVVANPPYLAKNKAVNKDIFNQSGFDDLYKIFLSTILEASGGLVIVPVNFLSDERSGAIRKLFFDTFEVLHVNYFTQPMFETTTYSVCTIFFQKKPSVNKKTQSFPLLILPEQKTIQVSLSDKFDYRLGGDFYHMLSSADNIFSRVVVSTENPNTNLFLTALDTRTDKINLTPGCPVYVGKSTDRMKATLQSSIPLTDEEQGLLAEEFNQLLNFYRDKYSNLILTNYRDHNRKRVGFDDAYRLASVAAKNLGIY